MNKVKTIDLKGKEYAQVKDRLKEFRNDCPNGLIESSYEFHGDNMTFKARVLKDKSNPASAEAVGHSFGPLKGEKAFEKLETIAVGRALALLGYAQDGEIASGEEMEEFLQFQEDKKVKEVATCKEKLEATKTLAELKAVWAAFPIEIKKELEEVKNQLKVKAVILGQLHENS